MYTKKLHYHQKVSCVKTFERRFFYFLCCIFLKYGFYNCEFKIIIVPEKFMWNKNLSEKERSSYKWIKKKL